MINSNRIVPVSALDLISLYGLILKQDTTNNSSLAKLDASDDTVVLAIYMVQLVLRVEGEE